MDIVANLLEHAEDEGKAGALQVAEDWRNTLEGIAEAGNAVERAAAGLLMGSLNKAIEVLMSPEDVEV